MKTAQRSPWATFSSTLAFCATIDNMLDGGSTAMTPSVNAGAATRELEALNRPALTEMLSETKDALADWSSYCGTLKDAEETLSCTFDGDDMAEAETHVEHAKEDEEAARSELMRNLATLREGLEANLPATAE